MLLQQEGIELPLENFGQGYQSMAPAVDEFERLLVDGLLKHDGTPLLTWNAANAVVTSDPAGNRKCDKAKATGRIDGLIASIMSAGLAIKTRVVDVSDWIV